MLFTCLICTIDGDAETVILLYRFQYMRQVSIMLKLPALEEEFVVLVLDPVKDLN